MLKWLKFKNNKKLLENMEDRSDLPPSFLEHLFSNVSVFILLGTIFLITFFVVGVYISQEKVIRSLKSEEKVVHSIIEDLTKQREKLEKELKEMSSPLYIEKQAREQLKMVKPGETVYVDIKKNKP